MAEKSITSEAPASETGAEDDNAGSITTMEDLAASFTERIESEEVEAEPTESEATEATEAESADAEEVEEDVLSKSISQGEEEEEDDEQEGEEESEGEPEEESGKESPAVGRLLKQVGKLTARAKGAEETVEAMRVEMQSLKTQSNGQTEAQAQGSPVLDDVSSLEDLEKVRQEALSAKKWALSHLGKDFVESEGKEYDGDQIRDIFAAADDYLTEKIPARGQFLQARQQWQVDAQATFPWLESQDGELFDLYTQIRGSGQYGAILDSLPNGDFVGATLARGIKATQDEQAAKAKPKKKARAKPPSSTEGDAAPPIQSKEARKAEKKRKSLGTGPISESQLAAYLT